MGATPFSRRHGKDGAAKLVDDMIRLTKHHGLGNDFLVLLEPPPDVDLVALARHLCDRRRGVGADGLLVARPAGESADVTMELRNADGGRAEMSGNGIRCFAQAVWEAGLVTGDVLRVATDAGLRTVRMVDRPGPAVVRASVDMGSVKVVGDATEWVGGSVQAAALVDAGNPHLVLLDPSVAEVGVSTRGPEIERSFPEGVNVEWIWPQAPGELILRVWERGAGETQACGTGSCAAAAAAASWDHVGSKVIVHNPGGDVTVELGEGESAVLTGPAQRVATVEVLWP
ncbi:MAG: diaminopimelate epimerase [Acidimicrobiales bacterium]